MPLLDQHGNEIDLQKLREEEARPTMTGVRSVRRDQVSRGMNPQRLASILRAADDGDADAYLQLAEEIEEKDGHYLSVIGTRKRAVSQLDIVVHAASDDPVDKDNAQFIRDWLDRAELQGELFDILDGIGKGYSVTEIIWDIDASRWVPKQLKWRDPRWFVFDRIDGETLRLRDNAGEIDLAPYKYIVHRHPAKSGIPIRGGVVRACAWMWLFKNFTVKDWVTFSEAYGQPIRIGKYGAGASDADRAVLLRAVANIGSDAGAIIPDSMMIEFIENQGKGASVDLYERLASFADAQMSKAVLGQTTTTDAMPGGGLAGNQSHNDVRGDIATADAVQLSSTLNQQLVRPMIDLNKGPQKKYPRIAIGETEDVDVVAFATTAEKGVNMGLRISRKKVAEKLGLPEAESDDDVLKPLPQPSPFGSPVLASQQLARPVDAIDHLSDELSGEGNWQEIMNPLLAMIETAARGATTYDEFNEKLLAVAEEMNMKPFAEKVARAIFSARVAGNLNVKLDK